MLRKVVYTILSSGSTLNTHKLHWSVLWKNVCYSSAKSLSTSLYIGNIWYFKKHVKLKLWLNLKTQIKWYLILNPKDVCTLSKMRSCNYLLALLHECKLSAYLVYMVSTLSLHCSFYFGLGWQKWNPAPLDLEEAYMEKVIFAYTPMLYLWFTVMYTYILFFNAYFKIK